MATGIDPKRYSHILALDEARTQGQIVAVDQAVRFGNYIVRGFQRRADALYMSMAANAMPTMVNQLLAANKTIQHQSKELTELRREIRALNRIISQQNKAKRTAAPTGKMIDSMTWQDNRNGKTYQCVGTYAHAGEEVHAEAVR
jgi:hypothetical protein